MCYNTGLQNTRTEQQRQKCQWAKNTNVTRIVACGNSSVWLFNLGRAACVSVCLWVLYVLYVCFMLSGGFCCSTPYVMVKWDVHNLGRLQSIIDSDSEYWKNIVVEINFQDGTQTLRSTDLEVISCWLRKTHSVDSRPCGSRQIAWLMAMCWKRMPVLCILAKMDMQTANSRLFGRGSLAHSKQWISGVWCLSWTWLCIVCLPLWQM